MSAPEPSARSHIWTMAVTHQAFRREFELAPRIVRDIAPDEPERHDRAADWFATMLGFMHHHHENEDLLMYPLLAGRAEQPLLDRMEVQHRELASVVDRAQERLSAWRRDDPASAEALAAAFDDMLPVLIEHVDAEEAQVMPLVGEYLTAEEYGRQGTRGNGADPRALMMTFGSVVEQASEREGEIMLAYPPRTRASSVARVGGRRVPNDGETAARRSRADLAPRRARRPGVGRPGGQHAAMRAVDGSYLVAPNSLDSPNHTNQESQP